MNQKRTLVRRRPVIRVFVSSTFADLKHERDALQRDVFPVLERLCASRGFQFQAIDLRWGVPSEASLDHRTMRICFEELRRSQEISPQPNFLILLGNRYGWRPLPEEVSVGEFKTLHKAASELAATDVLCQWYVEDTNTLPEPVYVFQSRTRDFGDGRDYKDAPEWKKVERVLWKIINCAYPPELLKDRFKDLLASDAFLDPEKPLPSIVKFQASATEQEIWRGTFGAANTKEHVLAFIREIDDVEKFATPTQIGAFIDVDVSGQRDQGATEALKQLKAMLENRLGENYSIDKGSVRFDQSKADAPCDVTIAHLDELKQSVQTKLTNIINRQMDEYWAGTDRSLRTLELETLEHQRFGAERAPEKSFVGRKDQLDSIAGYLQSDSRQPLVIHGASGCGKTALLARASQLAGPKWKAIVRFLGVTPHSSDIRSLLASLCQELRQRNPRSDELSGDVHELIRELHAHFNSATTERPLVLFLDALDQLADADNGRALRWIPFGPLPDHMKLVVSCLSDRKPDDPVGEPFAALKQRGLAEQNLINLDALSEDEARTLVFEHWLPEAKRRLNDDQRQRIQDRLKTDGCRRPLYLRILFEEARFWRFYDPTPALGENVADLLGALFERLEAPSNHGPTVKCALGYIASARRGLTETEILEVLYKEGKYEDSPFKILLEEMSKKHKFPEKPPRIPIAIWSRLRFDLGFYLTEHAAPGGTVISFYHRNLFDAVRERFLHSVGQQQAHARLAEYFNAQDYWLESLEEQQGRAKTLPPTPRPANVRKVDELPWQVIKIAREAHTSPVEKRRTRAFRQLETLFLDLEFLEAKTEAGLGFELVSDITESAKTFPPICPCIASCYW